MASSTTTERTTTCKLPRTTATSKCTSIGRSNQAATAASDRKALKHWTVKDGIINYDGKDNNLQTAKDYGNFEMYVDWKIEPSGDSGIRSESPEALDGQGWHHQLRRKGQQPANCQGLRQLRNVRRLEDRTKRRQRHQIGKP